MYIPSASGPLPVKHSFLAPKLGFWWFFVCADFFASTNNHTDLVFSALKPVPLKQKTRQELCKSDLSPLLWDFSQSDQLRLFTRLELTIPSRCCWNGFFRCWNGGRSTRKGTKPGYQTVGFMFATVSCITGTIVKRAAKPTGRRDGIYNQISYPWQSIQLTFQQYLA